MTPVWLDIDFDFFVRASWLNDFQYSEGKSPLLQNLIWVSRAAGWAARGRSLRDEMTPRDDVRPEAFVQMLRQAGWRFADSCMVVVGDSHAAVGVRVIQHLIEDDVRPQMVHVDAHHDLGYTRNVGVLRQRRQRGQCEAGDWLWHAARGLRGRRTGVLDSIRVVYPNWRLEQHCEESRPSDALLASVGVPVTFEYAGSQIAHPDGEVIGVSIAQSTAWSPPWLDAEAARFVDSFDMDQVPVMGGLVDRSWDEKAVASMASAERQCLDMAGGGCLAMVGTTP